MIFGKVDKKMKQPYFSVIVLAYKVEEYLTECLDSILHQTFQDFEVILVNPVSEDGTDEICMKYEKKETKIRRLVIENRGQLLNRVAGFQEAKGKYMLCVDGDDRWKPELLATVYEGLKEHLCDVVIFGHRRFKDEKELYVVQHTFSDNEVFQGSDGKQPVYDMLIRGGPINEMWAKVMSAETFRRIKEDFEEFSDIRIAEDWLYSFYVIEAAESILYLDHVLYEYRIRPDSMVHTFQLNELNDRLKVYSNVEKKMRELGLDTENNTELFLQNMARRMANWIYRCSISDLPYQEKKRLYQQLREYKLYPRMEPFLKKVTAHRRHQYFVSLFLHNFVLLELYSSFFRLTRKVIHSFKKIRNLIL